jgi:site-specific DNA-methyltransferase (cytosine-N4-specific)
MPYAFMPYESRLARLEAETLLNSRSVSKGDRLIILGRQYTPEIVDRLTYFSSVAIRRNGLEENHVTRQALIERSDFLAKRETRVRDRLRGSRPAVDCKWQARRYFSHGIHEYKGKFHPQIVKFIFNFLRLKPGNAVIDPFCGCGTTLVEAYVNDLNFLGVDINPLAVWIAKTKIEALQTGIRNLESDYRSLVGRAESLRKTRRVLYAPHSMPEENLRYLERWFTNSTLSKLFALSHEISRVEHDCSKNLFSIALSNILREVSLQEPRQLRTRRRKSACGPGPDVFQLFFSTLKRSLDSIRVFYELNLHTGRCSYGDVIEGDARSLPELVGRTKFDAAIFSPPYATALPYMDTDRLSLVYFNIVSPSSLRVIGRSMIGDREITRSERQEIEQVITTGLRESHLPYPIRRLIRAVYTKNIHANVGFRRKNVASLLHKYFFDMRETLRGVNSVLRPSGSCAFVVGNNTTIAGGTRVLVPTGHFLAMIGRDVGFKHVRTLTLNAYPRTDIHCKNSVREEYLAVLSK